MPRWRTRAHEATPLGADSFDPHARPWNDCGHLAWRSSAAPSADAAYFPHEGAWEKRDPAALGLDKAKLDEAIAFAIANENTSNEGSGRRHSEHVSERSAVQQRHRSDAATDRDERRRDSTRLRRRPSGAIPTRADMTFSVTKSFLSTVVGLAYDRGLIKDVNDRVAPYMPTGVDLFTSEHNAPITWDHLLRQTSDWYGELWGKPDWADRPSENGATPADWPKRPMREPGHVLQVQRHARERAVARDALRDEASRCRWC